MTCQHGRPRTPREPPLHRPPPPSATFARRLRAVGVGLVALLTWAVAAPAFLPAGALAAGNPAPGWSRASPRRSSRSAAEEARLRLEAWQRGREARRGRARPGGGPAAPPGAGATATPGRLGGPRRRPGIPALDPPRLPRGGGLGCRVRPGLPAPLDGPGRHRPHRVQSRPVGGAATRFSAAGTVSPRSHRPPLDGNGVASIPDSDGGRWDGDTHLGPGGRADAVHPTTWRTPGPRRQRRPGGRPQQPVRRRGERRRLPLPERRGPERPGPAAPGGLRLQPLLVLCGRGSRLGRPLPGGVAPGPPVPTGTAPPAPTAGSTSTTGAPGSAPPPSADPTTSTRRATTTRPPTTTSRRPTTTSPPSTSRPPTTTSPPTTGSPTTTTEPCQPTTTTTTTGDPTTTTSTTTTTTAPGGTTTTTTTTLPPC
jgi:hypothetical protein